MTARGTLIDSGHTQVGMVQRDGRFYARCRCGWTSGACRDGRAAGGAWNVHAIKANLDEAKGGDR